MHCFLAFCRLVGSLTSESAVSVMFTEVVFVMVPESFSNTTSLSSVMGAKSVNNVNGVSGGIRVSSDSDASIGLSASGCLVVSVLSMMSRLSVLSDMSLV